MQAAYILVPASRMSTGRGILPGLPNYLGLRRCIVFRILQVQGSRSILRHLPNDATTTAFLFSPSQTPRAISLFLRVFRSGPFC